MSYIEVSAADDSKADGQKSFRFTFQRLLYVHVMDNLMCVFFFIILPYYTFVNIFEPFSESHGGGQENLKHHIRNKT